MPDYLNHNLDILKKKRPELHAGIQDYLTQPFPGKISVSPNGLINLFCKTPDGTLCNIHPQNDPQANCEEFLTPIAGKEGQLIFFLGFGLGYEVLAACRRLAYLNQIYIIDHDPIFFAQALKFVDLQDMLLNHNVHIHIGLPLDAYPAIISRIDRWHLLYAPPYLSWLKPFLKIFPNYYQQAIERLNRLVSGQYMQSSTTVRCAREMLANTFQNYPCIVEGRPAEALDGLFPGKPAVIVSAGPSLKKNVAQLRGRENQMVIIATDSSVPTLMEHGIRPHFVVAMDYRQRNADAFEDHWEALQNTALIFLGLTTSLIPKSFQGKRYYIFDNAPVNEWFNRMRGISRALTNISSVALLGCHAAIDMGCEPIIFIGQDLALAGPVDEAKIRQEDLSPVPGINNDTVYTNPDFLVMIDRFENLIKQTRRTFIDATEGGAKIGNTRILPLAETLKAFCHTPFDFPRLPVNDNSENTIQQSLEFLAQSKKEFIALQDACLKIRDRASQGYDTLKRFTEDPRNNYKPFKVTDAFAEIVNYVRRHHNDIAAASSQSHLNEYSHILDTILAERRLKTHGVIIQWKKEHPESMGKTMMVSDLLLEMYSHRLQMTDMLEAIAWFVARIDALSARLSSPPGQTDLKGLSADKLVDLGNIYLMSLDLQEAENCFFQAEELSPEKASAHLGLGKVLIARQNPAGAMPSLARAAQLDPAYAEEVKQIIAKTSGEYLENAQDRIRRGRPGALKYLEKILPTFPDFDKAQELLTELQRLQNHPDFH